MNKEAKGQKSQGDAGLNLKKACHESRKNGGLTGVPGSGRQF
jgi:hypothetical protein